MAETLVALPNLMVRNCALLAPWLTVLDRSTINFTRSALSQWTSEEQTEASKIVHSIAPATAVINIPPGLDAREGGAAIVSFLVGAVRASGL